jgi:putative tricarboxylic transport membrane protein
MHGSRRPRLAHSFPAALLAALALAPAAYAQGFPSRPIEFIAHTSPGGGTDLFARTIADMLAKEKIFSQPFVVSNRTGGAGVVAFNYIKGKRGDPHVVMTIATGALLPASVRPELDLGLETYTPLALFAQDPVALAVRTESKLRTFRDLVDAARREPNALSAGLTGPAGSSRMALYLIDRETGAKVKYVVFKGGGDVVTATLGGHIDMTAENLSEVISQVEAKKMRVLALTGERRSAAAPDVPTLKELGYNIVAATGRGFAMPAGVPRAAAASMEAALKRVYDSPAYKEYAERNLFENTWLGSAEFAEYLARSRGETQAFLTALGLLKP